jgi:UDP-glucose 4-epimerase
MKVLITGVAGLLGSKLADWILANQPDVEVIGIDDLSGGFVDNVDRRVVFYRLDAGDPALNAIFERHRPDVVHHFAAYAAECLSPFIRCYNYRNNVEATANVINNCIKYDVMRLVFSSSMAVYGHNTPPFIENMTLSPVDPYGVAKYACEMDIQIAGKQHGLDWCILRPHNVYGPKQNIWDSYRNVLGIFMYKMLNGDPITVFGDGKQQRAFSYIDDALEPIWKAGVDPRASRQIINVGGTEETTINDAATVVVEAATELRHNGLWQNRPWAPDIIHLPPRHEVKYAYSSYEKSVELLDYKHETDLVMGVVGMWDWVLQQPNRRRAVYPVYEIEKGMYSYWKQDTLRDGYWSATGVAK